jgi:hypothetical protein
MSPDIDLSPVGLLSSSRKSSAKPTIHPGLKECSLEVPHLAIDVTADGQVLHSSVSRDVLRFVPVRT